MDFYNFFSFSAKKAVTRSQEVAFQFNNQNVEPEHLLFCINNVRSCSAVQVLHEMKVNVPKLAYSVEAYLYEKAGNEGVKQEEIQFSQRTIHLLDRAYKIKKEMNHREISTTHLLMALIADDGKFLKALFEEHGLTGKKVEEAFLLRLQSQQKPQVAEEGEISTPPEEEYPTLPDQFWLGVGVGVLLSLAVWSAIRQK